MYEPCHSPTMRNQAKKRDNTEYEEDYYFLQDHFQTFSGVFQEYCGVSKMITLITQIILYFCSGKKKTKRFILKNIPRHS